MKNITIKAIALVLTLILTLSLSAFADNGRIPMDGFDLNTNATGIYHGIRFSFPGYYENAGQQGNAVYFTVSGMTVGGDSPAYIAFDVTEQGYAATKSQFLQENGAILDRLISKVPNARELGREENYTVADYPAAAMDYQYQDDNGSYYSLMFLIYNQNTQEVLRVQLVETLASNVDFTDDFLKVIAYAQQTDAFANANPSATQVPAQQVSQKVKEYCDNFINSVNRAYELTQTVDLDNLGLVGGLILAAEIESIYETINDFYSVSTSGWSSADVAYYNQVKNSISDSVAKQILQWLDRATAGFLNW